MRIISLILLVLLCSCGSPEPENIQTLPLQLPGISLLVLGTLQDGGSPHIGCKKKCCESLFSDPDPFRKVVSLGLLDASGKKSYLLEATPDLPGQLRMLKQYSGFMASDVPDGIFLTHAHIGHYAGLMYLGREAMGADSIPVYVMPRMKAYLETNGPWSQLVKLKNIALSEMAGDKEVLLSDSLKITPFLVPHRDEFSETVGYRIDGPRKKALFIPDIDKWSKWNRSIVEEIRKVDYAFIDATFFSAAELQNRDISEIPHPLVTESMELFEKLAPADKNKIWFIHFNHTNPMLDHKRPERKQVLNNGFHIAEPGSVFPL